MSVQINSRPYTLSIVITNPSTVSNLGIQASASKILVVVKAWIRPAQSALPTAAFARVRLVRKTTAPTYTSILSSTFVNLDPSDADAAFTAGHTATAEGTDGDLFEDGWHSNEGWEWAPTPEEYIIVPAGSTNGLAVKHNVAPPAGAYAFGMTVHEVG